MPVRIDPAANPSQSSPSSPNTRNTPRSASYRQNPPPAIRVNSENLSNAESQPLLSGSGSEAQDEADVSGRSAPSLKTRRILFHPITMILAALVLVGLVVGFGGWMLGRGQGGGRWPGGPH